MFNHPAFWPTAGTVIVAAITALVGWLTGRRSDRVNLLEQQRKDFEVILTPMRDEIAELRPMRAEIAELRNESAANRTENAELRTKVEALERTDRDRDGLINDLLSWARSTIRWIEEKLPAPIAPNCLSVHGIT